MSTIRKQPQLEIILNDLTDDQKKLLLVLLNTNGSSTFYSLLDEKYYPEDKNAVEPCFIQFKEDGQIKTISGFLLISDKYKSIIEYSHSQNIYLYDLNIDKLTLAKINEEYTIDELRRELHEALNEQIINVTKDSDVEIGKNLYVDGKIYAEGGKKVPVDFKTIFGNNSLTGTGNIDLFNHFLTITASDGTVLYINFQSSNNLECDSLQDLTKMTKATKTNNTKIGFGSTYIIYDTTGVWKTANSTLITKVEDTVTTL